MMRGFFYLFFAIIYCSFTVREKMIWTIEWQRFFIFLTHAFLSVITVLPICFTGRELFPID